MSRKPAKKRKLPRILAAVVALAILYTAVFSFISGRFLPPAGGRVFAHDTDALTSVTVQNGNGGRVVFENGDALREITDELSSMRYSFRLYTGFFDRVFDFTGYTYAVKVEYGGTYEWYEFGKNFVHGGDFRYFVSEKQLSRLVELAAGAS